MKPLRKRSKLALKDIGDIAATIAVVPLAKQNFVASAVIAFAKDPNPKRLLKIGKAEFWEPDLPGLRKRENTAEDNLLAARERFFAARAELAETHAAHSALTDSFSSQLGKEAADREFAHIRDEEWDEVHGDAANLLKATGDGIRYIAAFITFDMTELPFKKDEAEKERRFLQRRIAEIETIRRQYDESSRKIGKGISLLESEMAALRAELAAKGIDKDFGGLDKLHLERAMLETRLEIAVAMLGDGIDPNRIQMATGLTTDEIAALPQPEPAEDTGSADPRDAARAMLIGGAEPLYVAELTGIDEDEILEIRSGLGITENTDTAAGAH
ncbi:hypothetical protein KCG44_08670 [Pacificimonas sp. WHA3]|uniref:Phage protein n=1 Tax=Pacificimonas pallii TaxID=2827236 RepID=A0ABS6SEM5_9SPHN|nr:hypothetical protein [Pacificimonas pallii]MBV7256858.1 hypothetical protein [Pacificimonas pallii]